MMKILRSDGSVLRVSGLAGLAELVADGLVGPTDRLFGGGRAVVKLGDLEEMSWAFAAVSDEEPYASYEVTTAPTG